MKRAFFIALGLLTVPATAVFFSYGRWHTGWEETWSRPVVISHLVAVAAASLGGVAMLMRRPSNPLGAVSIVLGAAISAFYISFYNVDPIGWRPFANSVIVYSLRPLLFWLVLAYPFGRLDRAGRRLMAVLVGGAAATFLLDHAVSEGWEGDPISVWDSSQWNVLARSFWWDVGALLMAAAVLVVVYRRRLRFRSEAAARLFRPAWIAAVVAMVGEIILVTTGPLRDLAFHDDKNTPFAAVLHSIDIVRFGLAPAILAIGALRTWPKQDTGSVAIDIDTDDTVDALQDTLRRALGDPKAAITLASTNGSWPVATGAGTVLTENGQPVAAIEFDPELAAHPAVVEAAVATVALQVEYAHQAAHADQRERELRAVGRAVLETEDDARRRLERDLHDGAQQELVGLTLHAALAARGGTTDAESFADAVGTVHDSLVGIATGRPPALLIERGLDGALGALALTAGIPVTVQADPCTDLTDPLQRAVWFSATEAVTNALKHAEATELKLELRRTNGRVVLTVADDGRGGVDRPPPSLVRRAADVGGSVAVRSNDVGTRVTIEFPAAVRSA